MTTSDSDSLSTAARYSCQLMLPEVGIDGQAALMSSSVLVVGAGGLASPVLSYLTGAGIGRVVLVDADRVEVSNLPRQFLYGCSDVGRLKVDAVRARLAQVAEENVLETHVQRFTPETAWHLLDGITVAVDASDNFGTRFLLNDVCRLRRVPWVHAGITRFAGLVATFLPEGPCYRCFFPEPPVTGRIPACGDGGVIGPAVGVVGSWQALEALKVCLGKWDATLAGRVLHFDLWHSQVETLQLSSDVNCLLCGAKPEIVSIDATEPSYRSTWGGS
jgi:adenylyltransferase/sulfurtransferase